MLIVFSAERGVRRHQTSLICLLWHVIGVWLGGRVLSTKGMQLDMKMLSVRISFLLGFAGFNIGQAIPVVVWEYGCRSNFAQNQLKVVMHNPQWRRSHVISHHIVWSVGEVVLPVSALVIFVKRLSSHLSICWPSFLNLSNLAHRALVLSWTLLISSAYWWTEEKVVNWLMRGESFWTSSPRSLS